MKTIILTIAAFALALTAGCTENQRAKSWGGKSNIALKCDQKLFDVTWKNADPWYATRPMRDDEKPESYTFAEESRCQ